MSTGIGERGLRIAALSGPGTNHSFVMIWRLVAS